MRRTRVTSYCFVSYLPARDGRGPRPDGPEGTRVVVLADLPGLGWGLCEVDENGDWSPEQLVTAELDGLIESAMRYPPALALARSEMPQVFGDDRPNQEEFARAYGVALRTHLSRQHEATYVMAQALKSADERLNGGEWYWVLQVSGRPAVASWVSADFEIHDTDMNDFDFTGQQLRRLGYAG